MVILTAKPTPKYKQQAVDLARRGFAVIPIVPERRFPPKGVLWNHQDYPKAKSPDEVAALFDKHPESWVGALTGHRSGGWNVIDFDTPDSPLEDAGINEEAQPVVKTKRGGHYWFRGEGVKTQANIVPKVDVRGEGGVAVLVGDDRSWVNGIPDIDSLPPFPEKTRALIEAKKRRRKSSKLRGKPSGDPGGDEIIPWGTDSKRGAVAQVADQLDINRETLRNWVRAAEINRGDRVGVTSEEGAELKELRRRNAELERANEILKAASAFFARELDRPQRR